MGPSCSHTVGMSREVTISVTFLVEDETLLRERALKAVAEYGMGVDLDGSLEDLVTEVLLHSNPGVESYDQYGLALIR